MCVFAISMVDCIAIEKWSPDIRFFFYISLCHFVVYIYKSFSCCCCSIAWNIVIIIQYNELKFTWKNYWKSLQQLYVLLVVVMFISTLWQVILLSYISCRGAAAAAMNYYFIMNYDIVYIYNNNNNTFNELNSWI